MGFDISPIEANEFSWSQVSRLVLPLLYPKLNIDRLTPHNI